MDEARRLRSQADDADRDATRAGDTPAAGAPGLLAKTKVISTYPTVAGTFYACESQGLLGSEVEGGAGTITTNGDTIIALNLGAGVPPVGTLVLLTYVPWRWVFTYG